MERIRRLIEWLDNAVTGLACLVGLVVVVVVLATACGAPCVK